MVVKLFDAKAYLQMIFTLFHKDTWFRLLLYEAHWNAHCKIWVTVSGIITEVSYLLLNAFSHMIFTSTQSISDGISMSVSVQL